MTSEHHDIENHEHDDLPQVRQFSEGSKQRLRRGFGYIASAGTTVGGGFWAYKLLGNAETIRALTLTTGGASWFSLVWLNRPVSWKRKEVGNNFRTAKRIAVGALSLSATAFSMSYNTKEDSEGTNSDDTEQGTVGSESTILATDSALDCPIDFTQIGLPEGQGDVGAISVLQLALRDLDYYPKKIDGKEGPVTRGALDSFEANSGLDPAQSFSLATCDLLFSPEAIRADA
jgi:hypothetical protein